MTNPSTLAKARAKAFRDMETQSSKYAKSLSEQLMALRNDKGSAELSRKLEALRAAERDAGIALSHIARRFEELGGTK